MGYMGLGMQRWIFTLKPRKFLGKRSKPDGGGGESHSGIDIQEFYQIEKHVSGLMRKKDYPAAYRKKLLNMLLFEKQHQRIVLFLALLISVILLCLLSLYLNQKMHWF